MLNEIIDTLTIPFTEDLEWRQMFLAFSLFLVVAILSLDVLNMLKQGAE
jgi:hypothetical protein